MREQIHLWHHKAELMKNLGKAKNTEAKPEEFALRLARLEMQIGLNN